MLNTCSNMVSYVIPSKMNFADKCSNFTEFKRPFVMVS